MEFVYEKKSDKIDVIKTIRGRRRESLTCIFKQKYKNKIDERRVFLHEICT